MLKGNPNYSLSFDQNKLNEELNYKMTKIKNEKLHFTFQHFTILS